MAADRKVAVAVQFWLEGRCGFGRLCLGEKEVF